MESVFIGMLLFTPCPVTRFAMHRYGAFCPISRWLPRDFHAFGMKTPPSGLCTVTSVYMSLETKRASVDFQVWG